ncbi:MAG: VIT1/CCC1 transporter family protein [Candidatus Woesearchaeota archaeon]|nr:MAG: VIT1/CCC1 transporter family protein [Candidatus Woesearchaeota archaeon]
MYKIKTLNNQAGKSVREIVFGVEDGLVTTLGLTAGVAISINSNNIVIISAIAGMVAGAVSMAAGTYLSSKTQLEFLKTEHKNKKELKFLKSHFDTPSQAAIVIFLFYLLGGIIPIFPYAFLTVKSALSTSILLTVVSLFLVGCWKTKLTKRSWLKSGLEMVLVGILAALIGYLIGTIATYYTGI